MARFVEDESGELLAGYFYQLWNTFLLDETFCKENLLDGWVRTGPAVRDGCYVESATVVKSEARSCSRDPRHRRSAPKLSASLKVYGHGTPSMIVPHAGSELLINRDLNERLQESPLVGVDTFRCTIEIVNDKINHELFRRKFFALQAFLCDVQFFQFSNHFLINILFNSGKYSLS